MSCAQNRLQESLSLFNWACNSRWLKNVHIVLLFTKFDVFREKIREIPLERYFPDYQGGPSAQNALSFITRQFMALNGRTEARNIPTFTTTLTSLSTRDEFWTYYESVILGHPFGLFRDPPHLFAMSVMLNDRYLKLKKRENNPNLLRFINIMLRLPMDLQMVLCHRTTGSIRTLISVSESERALRDVFSLFSSKTAALKPLRTAKDHF